MTAESSFPLSSETDLVAYERLRAQGAVAMLEVAETSNIGLRVNDVAERLGEEPTPAYRVRPVQTYRWDKVLMQQEIAAGYAEQEFQQGIALAKWLNDLGREARASIQVEPAAVADDYMLTPMRLVVSDHYDHEPFELGQSFAFLPPVPISEKVQEADKERYLRPDLGLLPDNVQEFLEAKRTFWATLGVHNGFELKAFLKRNFNYYAVDADNLSARAEVDWLISALPTARAVLEQGGQVHLRRLKRTPDTVLDHIHTISQTQHTFLSWLGPYVCSQETPEMVAADYAAPEAARLEAYERLDADRKMGEFRRQLLKLQADQLAEAHGDIEGALQGIANFAKIALGVEVGIPHELSAIDRQQLASKIDVMNGYLDDEFGHAEAVKYMLDDIAKRHEKGMLNMLWLAGGLIVTGGSIELLTERYPNLAFLHPLIYVLALLEDPVSEAGEAFNQHSLGYKWRQIAKRYKVIGPVAAISVGLGFTVEPMREQVGDSLTMVDYAIAGCATTIATLGTTLHTAVQAYRAQVADGKVPGQTHRTHVDRAGRKELREVLTNAPSPDERRTALQEGLRQNINPDDFHQLFTAIEDAIRDGDIEKAIQSVKVPYREALRVAWHETVGLNVARKGKLAGVVEMVGLGPLPPVANAVLGNVILTMAFSMGEPANGLAATYVKRLFARPYRAYRVRRTARQLRATGQAISA